MYGSNSTAILNASYKPYHAYTRFESPLKYSEQMGLTHSPEKQKNYSSERYPISGPQPSSYYKVYDRFPADCYLIGKDADPTLKNEGAPPVTVFNHGQPSFLHQYSSVRSNERSRSVNAAYAKNPQEKMYETNSFSQSNGFRETMKMPNYNSNSSALGKTTNDFRKGLHYDYNSSEFRKTANEFGRGSHNNLKPFGKTTNDFGKGLNYDSNSNAFRRTANDFGGRGSYNNYNSGSDSYKNDFSRTSKDGMGRHSYQPRALDATKTRKWY